VQCQLRQRQRPLTTLSTDPAAGAAHATALIAAINTVATSNGFSSAVVVSTAADIAGTFTLPTQVTITLPSGGSGGGLLTNGNLDGPATGNAIAGWTTTAATVTVVDADGRSGVISVADAGSFSAIAQSITTVPGQNYFVTFDVWADPLANTAGQAYCTTTDSNGILDIHAGIDADGVARHGESRLCPVEGTPGTWQTVEGVYQATDVMTTFALHSESGWAAFFDSISVTVAEDMVFEYIGCFRDNEGGRDMVGSGPDGVASVPVDAAVGCATACAGYSFFGLQWVNECFCDNSYNNGYGNNGNQGNCPGGECPITDCDADGAIVDGVADLCANGVGNCGNRNAVYSVGPAPAPTEEYCEASSHDYRGVIATTVTGRTCQFWAAQTPHGHTRTPNNYPEFGLEGEHNYCRNPDRADRLVLHHRPGLALGDL